MAYDIRLEIYQAVQFGFEKWERPLCYCEEIKAYFFSGVTAISPSSQGTIQFALVFEE